MTTHNEKMAEMKHNLSEAYKTDDIKKNPELRNMVFGAAKELEQRQDPELTATHVYKNLMISYNNNPKKFPEAAKVLMEQMKTTEADVISEIE